ncbi:MAG: DNA-binding domain-containing protein [Burkholderiales bacterium]
MTGGLIDREAERQQALLQAILHQSDAAALQPWLRDDAPRGARGLAAYRANLQGSAERALAAAYPVLVQLLGEESFAGLARAYLHAQPPERGDLAWYGDGLPAFIACSPLLADEPYLADVARLEWALHKAADAADEPDGVQGLARLGDTDPADLRVRFTVGAALVGSRHAIATIWQVHQADVEASSEDRFAPARQALAEQRAETAWVWRAGWRPQVAVLTAGEGAFHSALLSGRSLAQVMSQCQAHPDFTDFNFEAWLTRALREGWLASIECISTEENPS